MPRTVSSVVHVKLPAHEAWRARSSLELEQQIAALGKRKLTLLEREVLDAGADDEQERRVVRCDLTADFLGGSILGVKTSDLGSRITSTHYTHLFDEAHGAAFTVGLLLTRVNLSISGKQWCEPESENDCFMHTRVEIDAKILGVGGLIERQLERQLSASHAAFPEHAYAFLATLPAPSAPTPVLTPVPTPVPTPPECCGSSRPTLGQWWLVGDAIARGVQRVVTGSTGRRHAVLRSTGALPGNTVPLRVERRTARVLLLCGCASSIVDSDEIIE